MPVITHEQAAALVLDRCNVEILEPYVSSKAKWKMRCLDCGQIVEPKYTNIQQGHSACGYCAGNTLLTHDQAAALVLDRCNVEILEPYPGAVEKWKMRCLDCGKEVAPRYCHIHQGVGPCRSCAAIGPYNQLTLGRDPQVRWRRSNLYVRKFWDEGHNRFLYKVGIGTEQRANDGRGKVIELVRAPRAVAFIAEQRILKSARRVAPSRRLERNGDTEVIADYQAALDGVAWMSERLAAITTDDDRRAFDAEHFPGCVPVGTVVEVEESPQLQLFS